MRFGPVPLAEAEGAILAHSERVAEGRLRKGVTLERAHLDALAAAGLPSTDEIAIRLKPLLRDHAVRAKRPATNEDLSRMVARVSGGQLIALPGGELA